MIFSIQIYNAYCKMYDMQATSVIYQWIKNKQKRNKFIYIYIKDNIHTYIHACMHTYIHTYIYRYIHIYIYTDTYIHTYIHGAGRRAATPPPNGMVPQMMPQPLRFACNLQHFWCPASYLHAICSISSHPATYFPGNFAAFLTSSVSYATF